jgi:DNA-binding PadR family transcriptional regulator
LISKEFTYGNLYSALNQLVKKKYVFKKIGDPTPDRRGRPKAFYSITPSGLEALNTAREINDALWGSVSKYAFK